MTTCPRCRRTFDDGVRFCPVDGTLVTTLVDPYLGKTLMGQFRLTALAGRGAMGSVYRAEQFTVDRPVAVKLLRRDLMKDELIVKRFLREARAAARLNHPNIVTIHVVGEADDGVPFIVMEFVDGGTLGALCDKESVLPPRRALNLCRQIASALAEAHGQGIVHRDLKPENILLVGRRDVDVVKVLDFGIAKIADGELGQLTREGTIFGTPHYISPEQAGGQEVDHRADLYSLGVILFRMTTGRLPFEGTSGMQVIMRHLREPPPKPRSIRPELPAALESVILTALEKERGNRFQDAHRFVAAIDSVLRALDDDASTTLMGVAPPPDPASADGKSRPMPRVTGAQRRVPDADPALVRDVPADGSLEAWAARPPADTDVDEDAGYDPAEEARRRRARTRLIAVLGLPVLAGVGAGVLYARRGPPSPSEPVVARAADAGARPKLALLDEQVGAAGAFTVRMGFVREPVAGEPTQVRLLLDDGRGPVGGASVEVGVRGAGGREQVVAGHEDASGYLADVTFRAPGRQRLRVDGEGAAGGRFSTSFDIDVLPASGPTTAAEVARPSPAPVEPRPEPAAAERRPRAVASTAPVATGRAAPRRGRTAAASPAPGSPEPASPAAEDGEEALPVTVLKAEPEPVTTKPRALGPAPGALPPSTPPARPDPSDEPSPSLPPPPKSEEPAPAPSEGDPYKLLDKN